MKRRVMAAAVLAGVLALCGGTAYAAGQVARSNAIGEETARNFAYVDAGVLPENATVIGTEFDFENGRFVYEIEFTANSVKYEYTVDSTNGRILKKEEKQLPGSRGETPASGVKPQPEGQANASTQETASAPSAELIGLDRAKEIALKQAGLSAADVVFSKAKLERDDGRLIYDVEFYVAGKAEYDYEIDAASGDVLGQSYEEWDKRDSAENRPVSSAPAPQEQTPAPAAVAKPDAPAQQAPAPADVPKPDAPPAASRQEAISVDRAKEIALQRAGRSAADVVFEKAKLERDDGRLIYDVEFYAYGQAEYDYEIDAYTGAILDEEMELWETDDD